MSIHTTKVVFIPPPVASGTVEITLSEREALALYAILFAGCTSETVNELKLRTLSNELSKIFTNTRYIGEPLLQSSNWRGIRDFNTSKL